LSKSHAQKLIVAGKTLSAVVSVVAQNTLIELMHWHEVHDVTKNKFTRITIHEFLLFYQDNSGVISRSKKLFTPNKALIYKELLVFYELLVGQ
jgi:hypothetical protein